MREECSSCVHSTTLVQGQDVRPLGASSQVVEFLFVRLATGCAFAHACWFVCGGFAIVLCYKPFELGV